MSLKKQWILELAMKHGANWQLTEAERSFTARQNLLQSALRDSDLCPHDYEYCGCWVMDTFDTYMVYSSGGETYKVDYSIAEDGTVTLGTAPVEVLPTMTYPDAPVETEPVQEGAEIRTEYVPLIESALTEATAQLKLIQPGWGSSGYYPASTLKAAAGEFPAGTKMFWNHQTAAEEAARPEGNLDHLAAELTEDSAYREDGPAGPGLYARAKVFDKFKGAVKDLKDSIGVSIRAWGLSKPGEAEGRKGPIVEKITGSKSVDFVTIPGAGGKILELFEAAGRQTREREEKPSMTDEQIKALVESAVVSAVNTAVKPFQEAAATTTTELARLREAGAIREAKDFAVAKLKTITLPDATRTRLAESLALNPPMKDGALDTAAFITTIEAAAKVEAEYLQRATGMGAVRGMGSVAGGAAAVEVKEADLVAGFVGLGMSEAAAKIAAAGRPEAW